MKIDIHVHTRKIKSGDAITRNIETAKFGEILKGTDVKILAITNHNHFDLKQFEEFQEEVITSCQVWPGIELDILENGKRAHLIIIVSPVKYVEFNERVQNILRDTNPDTFTITLDETVKAFDDLDCVYVAHYYVKKPNLGDKEIEKLATLIANPKRILKEATNSISAGIYISHGHNSIHGSDIQDWDQYINLSKELPELRLPVESFEQFCLLLEKDEATINTLLNKKVKENIELAPFTLAELIRIDIYNDINILFGSKGTGKTEILEAISKYFNERGHKTSVYKSNDQHLNDVYDIKGHDYDINVVQLGLEECEDEIAFLKMVTEEDVTSISKYTLHYSTEETNKISQKLKIKNIANIDESQPERRLDDVHDVLTKLKSFRTYVEDNEILPTFTPVKVITDLLNSLETITGLALIETEDKFLDYNTIKMVNGIVELFNLEIAKKTGQPPKPPKTGFSEYARNRIKIERSVKKILVNIGSEIKPSSDYVGSLGNKGDLFFQTNLLIQDGNIINSSFSTVKSVNKTPQKDFSRCVLSISKHIYSNDLFSKISALNEIEGSITTVSDLLLFCRHFTLNGAQYNPSNGESSMLLLHKELKGDKDIYLIDEPEKSLGNDYINDVIVPLLKEKASLGKKVIIATHDANIAVRTLPYNSIYRLHDKNQYFTLTGNPFSNSLKCIHGVSSALDWKEISMKTLEGGKEAFGERGKIYGN